MPFYGNTNFYHAALVEVSRPSPLVERETPDAVIDLVVVHAMGANENNAWPHYIHGPLPVLPSIVSIEQRQHGGLLGPHFLPSDFPHTRILKLEYESNRFERPNDWNLAELVADSALLLLYLLLDRRNTSNTQDRPIVFVSFCTGGLVVLKALNMAYRGHSFDQLWRCTTGAVFLGTPFWASSQARQTMLIQTSMLAHLNRLGRERGPPEYWMANQDEFLAPILEEARAISLLDPEPIHYACFVEMVPCTEVTMYTPDRWALPYMVGERAVCQDLGRRTSRFKFECSHFRLHSFPSQHHPDYRLLVFIIGDYINRGVRLIPRRLAAARGRA